MSRLRKGFQGQLQTQGQCHNNKGCYFFKHTHTQKLQNKYRDNSGEKSYMSRDVNQFEM